MAGSRTAKEGRCGTMVRAVCPFPIPPPLPPPLLFFFFWLFKATSHSYCPLPAAMLDFTVATDDWYATWASDQQERAFAMYVSLSSVIYSWLTFGRSDYVKMWNKC